jgi:PII-like signaling protein
MSAFILYFVSHWALVGATTLVVIVLGGLAYLLRSLKLAGAAILIAVAGFFYQGTVMHGINLQLAKDAAVQIQILQDRQTALNNLALSDAMQAQSDNELITKLKKEANATPKNNGVCLDPNASRRVGRVR